MEKTIDLITVEYHSNFFEVDLLPNTSSDAVTWSSRLTSPGMEHEMSLWLTTAYNMCQRPSKSSQISGSSSSPGYQQANGAAEAAVKTAKRMLWKCQASKEAPFLAFLNLQKTPTEGLNTSPAPRLLGILGIPASYSKHYNETWICRTWSPEDPQETRRNLTTPLKDLKSLAVGQTVRIQPIRTKDREWKEVVVTKTLHDRS